MEILICPDRDQAIRLAAEIVIERVRTKPTLNLGLAAGQTMVPLYERLRAERTHFSEASGFQLDEFVGLGLGDPASFAHYLRSQFFDHVDMRGSNIHLMDGTTSDLLGEAARFEALIKAKGGIDLQLLGIGMTGHIGFNEPVSSLNSRTRIQSLSRVTAIQNAPSFDGDANLVPKQAITQGVGTILEAKEALLIATGAEKGEVLARAIEGPLSARVSASALQMHNNCKVILDLSAAAFLHYKDHYIQSFMRNPRWQNMKEALRV